jgi:hypothetical protein
MPAITKEQQLYRKRVKPTQKQMGAISAKVRMTVNNRSAETGYPRCEGCHKNKSACWTLENAHVEGRRSISHKTTEYDLLRLCGPSTDSGTCHHFVESTKQGKQYMKDQRDRLRDGLKPLTIKEWGLANA